MTRAPREVGRIVRPMLMASALAVFSSVALADPIEVEAGRVAEITFTSTKERIDPFYDATVDVIFTTPDGQSLRVPAFWAGGETWKVRYSSRTPGAHAFVSECTDADDAALHGVSGVVNVVPYQGDDPLLRHGPIRVADDGRRFSHADGTPFFWLGDTWWMGLVDRLAWPEDFQTLTADRVAKGFNVVQLVAGLYPDMPAFDPRGRNEAGFPWEPEYARINPAFFDAADQRIAHLVEQGITPCVLGAWGYHILWLGEDKMKQHWRYLIARWGAYPVVWSAAGETTMAYYLTKTRREDGERQQREWTEVVAYIREIDPFRRMLTTHPVRQARASVTDPSLLDFEMQQTGHRNPPERHAAAAYDAWKAEPSMPVISGEARYEALEINPTLTADDARKAFWSHIISSGCAGHTYGANGVWQVNRPDKPYGPSPAGNNWGTIPWDDSRKLPGSSQLAIARTFLESLVDRPRLDPHPEHVAWADADAQEPAPVCATAPNGARLVYLLSPGAVVLNDLPADVALTASWFNPISGERGAPFDLTPSPESRATVSPPEGDHDWVLAVETKSRP